MVGVSTGILTNHDSDSTNTSNFKTEESVPVYLLQEAEHHAQLVGRQVDLHLPCLHLHDQHLQPVDVVGHLQLLRLQGCQPEAWSVCTA